MRENPATTSISWKSSADIINEMPQKTRQWLAYRGSLTKRLRQAGAAEINHIIRQEKWELPTAEEAQYLQLNSQESVFIRETDWQYKNNLWVMTRALIPLATLQNKGKDLQTVGSRSLGDFLFTDPDLQRSEFEFASFIFDGQVCWARRSLFSYWNKPLLVSEIFFPSILNSEPPADE